MINTITAEWSETIKKENGYFVFRYLLKGEEFRIRVLSKGKKHNQIIVLDEKLYFESWIYYGQEGVLSYDGEADRRSEEHTSELSHIPLSRMPSSA